jgi:hypothetical protein
MADDKPSYKKARAARNVSRVVVEGVDEPEKHSKLWNAVPKDYKSPDVIDNRNDDEAKERGMIQHITDPLQQ